MKATILFFLSVMIHSQVIADDRSDITNILNEFLTKNSELVIHQKFWADDLIYTSSRGKRFGKNTIILGMKNTLPQTTTSQTIYSAQDIDIRLYGDIAILVFKLVAQTENEDPSEENAKYQHFYNTGTMIKRAGRWQAVAWQATKILND